MVPVENHVKFEKVKSGSRKDKLNAAETKAAKDKQISEKLTEVLQKKNLATVAPKKENLLSRLRNTIKKSIAAGNQTIIRSGNTAQMEPTDQPKTLAPGEIDFTKHVPFHAPDT